VHGRDSLVWREYNTNQPDANRLIKADLDGFGERPVPQLCMICHGGQAASEAADPNNPNGPKKGAFQIRTDIVSMNSQFLPFDLHFFTMPAAKPNQQTAFKNLNVEIVRKVAQGIGALGQPTRDIIDAWYANNSAVQIDGAVITNWDAANPNSDDNRLYKDVFARACRTCHNAGPFTAPSYQDKNDFRNDIATVQTRVCSQRVMSHALRTNQLFWNSLTPSMPAFLQLYGQTLPGWSAAGADQCGTFVGGGTIASVFDNKIYPILTNRCTGCHTQTGNANWHIGGGANATYSELLNAATNVGGNYIVPNNSGASVLFQRISQMNPGRMPLGGADLATVDVDNDGVKDLTEILNWINLGAPR
jgi:mono/diheme cytochrome c family protein